MEKRIPVYSLREPEYAGVIHSVKTDSDEFSASSAGRKTFEIRKNDRDYQVGDILELVEIKPQQSDEDWMSLFPSGMRTAQPNPHFTGKKLLQRVMYILRGPEYEIPEGYCIMATKNIDVSGVGK